MNPLVDLPPEALDYVARYFRALSEPTRLRILNVLGAGEMSVGEIAERVNSSIANVSRHLSQMAECGLVAREQQGNSALYSVCDPVIDELCELVCNSIARRFDEASVARRAFSEHLPGGG